MTFQEAFERKIREVDGGYGIIPLHYMNRYGYQLVQQIDEHRLMYTRLRYNGEAMDHIIGRMYITEKGEYGVGTNCVVTHYTENDVTTLVGISFCTKPHHENDADADFLAVLAELRKFHQVDLGGFPSYEHKGY